MRNRDDYHDQASVDEDGGEHAASLALFLFQLLSNVGQLSTSDVLRFAEATGQRLDANQWDRLPELLRELRKSRVRHKLEPWIYQLTCMFDDDLPVTDPATRAHALDEAEDLGHDSSLAANRESLSSAVTSLCGRLARHERPLVALIQRLTQNLVAEGKLQEAAGMLKEAMEDVRRTASDRDISYAAYSWSLGRLESAMASRDDAIAHLQDAADLFLLAYGHQHEGTLGATEDLLATMEAAGKNGEATIVRDRLRRWRGEATQHKDKVAHP